MIIKENQKIQEKKKAHGLCIKAIHPSSLEAWNKYLCNHLLRLISSATQKKIRGENEFQQHIIVTDEKKNQGLRARDNPNLGVFSKALVSNSLETVKIDFGMSSCCKTVPSFPWLLSFSLTTVRLSSAYDPPTVNVFSFVENFLAISPVAELFISWSKWCTSPVDSPPLALFTAVDVRTWERRNNK